jgi:hypothetical protein
MPVFQLYCNINSLVVPVIRNCHLRNMLTKGPKYKTFTTPVYWFKEQVETPTEELAIFYIHWMFYSSYLCTLSRLQMWIYKLALFNLVVLFCPPVVDMGLNCLNGHSLR